MTNMGPKGSDSNAQAGANGLVTWSSKSAAAADQTVGPDAGPFDDRAGNLSGYNAGEPVELLADQSAPRSGQAAEPTRQAPRRPSGYTPASSLPSSDGASVRDDAVLRPLGSQPADAPLSPVRSRVITYTVQPQDSLWKIGRRFGLTDKEIQAANPGLTVNIQPGQVLNIPRQAGADEPAPEPKAQAQGTLSEGTFYTVKSGDSLSRIASRQGITLAQLREANGMAPADNTIRIGQKLVIPAAKSTPQLVSRQFTGRKVVVKTGDTVGGLAKRYGVSLDELRQLNGIKGNLIRVGQTLLIPEGGQEQQSASSSAAARQAAPASRAPAPKVAPPPTTPPTRLPEITPAPAPLDTLPLDTLPSNDSPLDTLPSEPAEIPTLQIEE